MFAPNRSPKCVLPIRNASRGPGTLVTLFALGYVLICSTPSSSTHVASPLEPHNRNNTKHINQESIGSGSALPSMEMDNSESTVVDKRNEGGHFSDQLMWANNLRSEAQHRLPTINYQSQQPTIDWEKAKHFCQQLASNGYKSEMMPLLMMLLNVNDNEKQTNKHETQVDRDDVGVGKSQHIIKQAQQLMQDIRHHLSKFDNESSQDLFESCFNQMVEASLKLKSKGTEQNTLRFDSTGNRTSLNKRSASSYWYQDIDFNVSGEGEQLMKKLDFLYGHEGIRFRKRNEETSKLQINSVGDKSQENSKEKIKQNKNEVEKQILERLIQNNKYLVGLYLINSPQSSPESSPSMASPKSLELLSGQLAPGFESTYSLRRSSNLYNPLMMDRDRLLSSTDNTPAAQYRADSLIARAAAAAASQLGSNNENNVILNVPTSKSTSVTSGTLNRRLQLLAPTARSTGPKMVPANFYRQLSMLHRPIDVVSWYKRKPFNTQAVRFKKNPFDKEGIRFKRSPFLIPHFTSYPFSHEGIRFKKSPFEEEGIRFKKSPFEEEGIRFKKSPFDEEGIRFKKSPFDEEGIRFKKSPFDEEGIRFKKSPFDEEGIRFKKSPFDEEGIRFKKSPFDQEGIRFKKSPFDQEGIRFKKSPFDQEGIRFKKSPFDEEGIRYK